MRFPPKSRVRRRFSASLLLVALLFRAYVPLGFMPAVGTPFLLALCPEGLSAPVPAHHEHHGSVQGHDHFEHCPFGSVSAGGPWSAPIAVVPPAPISAAILAPAARLPWPVRLFPAHAPRGPPAPA